MPRAGELTYYDAIGECGRLFALNKPFSQTECGLQLMQVGAILELLPPPPARVLDCGCGTGWLSYFLQKRGYDVVGIDVAPRAIELALTHTFFHDLEPPDFQVADCEDLPFVEEFDAVVFFDSLHHAINEQQAIASAYRALRSGGVCIASETNKGHAHKAREVADRYDVTEKDMPPAHIGQLGRVAGFSKINFYPRADNIGSCLLHPRPPGPPWLSQLMEKCWPLRALAVLYLTTWGRTSRGITVLHK
jgi:SAM-dependent methyltransferase